MLIKEIVMPDGQEFDLEGIAKDIEVAHLKNREILIESGEITVDI